MAWDLPSTIRIIPDTARARLKHGLFDRLKVIGWNVDHEAIARTFRPRLFSGAIRHRQYSVYLGRTDEVVLGEASTAVRAKAHFTRVEVNLQAGMMVFLMRDLGHLIDKGYRLPEIFEAESMLKARRFSGLYFPSFMQLRQK
ncbi:hypothetical protein CAGGBEG34_40007 [Candidatus Glomeribacter gigasporarum BEG34]|uniref:Uncharacterized protein n=1 Tax=Candidatus Glomeribacter gigasporarum BEG34 TaxID=1070319 RepID=G2JBK7_9BURK|nr:hypothetical protein CAGGBEG34_40007 [Candidatus Glomeribacter gigasporarum BEG34]